MLAALLLVPGCSNGDERDGDEVAATPTVVLDGIAFNSAEIIVNAGQTVRWRFDGGSAEHIVKGATFANHFGDG